MFPDGNIKGVWTGRWTDPSEPTLCCKMSGLACQFSLDPAPAKVLNVLPWAGLASSQVWGYFSPAWLDWTPARKIIILNQNILSPLTVSHCLNYRFTHLGNVWNYQGNSTNVCVSPSSLPTLSTFLPPPSSLAPTLCHKNFLMSVGFTNLSQCARLPHHHF